MKNLLTTLLLTLGLGMTSAQLTPTSTIAKKKIAKTETNATIGQGKTTAITTTPSSVRMKKDGTPDKRYKAARTLKKNGTPDRRYKANK